MIRRLIIFVALAVAAVPVLAQEVVLTEAYIAFKNVRNPDGSITSSQGGFLPIRIEAIKASDMAHGKNQRGRQRRDNARPSRGFGSPRPVSAQGIVVYQNDAGPFFFGNQTQSALDDLVFITGSEQKAWTVVSFGVHLSTANRSGNFLVRWQGWQTFVSGRGEGLSAFDNPIPFFDFGFYLNRGDFAAGSDSFLVTVDLSLIPLATVPNLICYFAQQFREPNVVGFPPREDGEGPFTDVWNVFTGGGPQVGSSQDIFFFDTLTADGIYDETEADNFGPGNEGKANFLLKVQVAGETLNLPPGTFQWIRGSLQSGNLGSLWQIDANYNVAQAGFTLFLGEPPAQLVVETFVSRTDATGIRFDVTARVNTPGLNQRVEFWNFITNSWDTVSDGPATTSDSTTFSFAAVPAFYVDGSLVLRAKVSWYRTGFTLLWPWTVTVDQVHWVIVYP